MGLWKYDTIVGLWHFEDGADSVGSNTITLTGTTTVPGKLDNAQSFTTNDYGVSDGLITSLASVTKGTIAGWVYVDSDNNDYQYIMVASKAAGTGATDHRVGVRLDFGSTRNRLAVYAIIGGVAQFDIFTDTGSLTAHIGSWLAYEIDMDGVEITDVRFNGVSKTVNYGVTTDKTVWFADVITAGADTFSWGSRIFNSVRAKYLEGDLDETMINSELWDATDSAAFWNGGAGTAIEDPNANSGLTTRLAR